MRVRLRTGPTALFLALFVAAALVFLPLRLALGWAGAGDAVLTARAVSGSVWSGRMSEARFGALALGDLDAGLAPLPLLIGRARFTLASPDGDAPDARRGALTLSRSSIGVDDVTGTLPTGSLFAPLPVNALTLEGVSVRFTDGTCERAEGRVRVTVAGDVAGVPLAQALAGEARCEGGRLLLPLRDQGGVAAATIRLGGDGQWRAELLIGGGDPATAERLERAGFVRTPAGYRLSIEGSL